MTKENKNQNRKRTTEMKLIGKKARNLSKKRAKIDRIQRVPKGNSQKKTFQNWSIVGILEQRHGSLWHGEGI
jgi:hypothetical protein